MALSRRTKRWVKAHRYRALAAVGIHRYTWASLYGLDRKLVEYFGGRAGGRFIELRGNDGLQQSNTLALARLFGWRGLLIEPGPELAAECRRNRAESMVVCVGCWRESGVSWLHADDLTGRLGDGGQIPVPVLPLSMVLDGVDAAGNSYDLLSLDVEGAELEVLAGIDLDRHAPGLMLIETSNATAVEQQLSSHYRHIGQWSHHDHAFERR